MPINVSTAKILNKSTGTRIVARSAAAQINPRIVGDNASTVRPTFFNVATMSRKTTADPATSASANCDPNRAASAAFTTGIPVNVAAVPSDAATAAALARSAGLLTAIYVAVANVLGV